MRAGRTEKTAREIERKTGWQDTHLKFVENGVVFVQIAQFTTELLVDVNRPDWLGFFYGAGRQVPSESFLS